MTDEEWRELITKRLRSLRYRAGFHNQKELAEACGVPEATISNYINCRRLPSAKQLVKLAQTLNCTIDELIYVDETIE